MKKMEEIAKELETEIEIIEQLYCDIEKTEEGTPEDWKYSGLLEGLRYAHRIASKLELNE